MQTNELRVFISSTFRDLQEEREHLVKKIFPEIRALCRERGITFTEVDLRWGLTEEEGTLGRIIRTCLEEIDRCRPYFIGITGDRYGYIPELHEIYKDPILLRDYPWIEDAVAERMSLIELEYRYAMLGFTRSADVETTGDTELSTRNGSRFYFRRQRAQLSERNAVDRWSRDETDADSQRLDALKGQVRDAGLPVGEFRDPVSLGEMVYDDLVAIIARDFADTRLPGELERERSAHEAFAASRRHAYIPNAEHSATLNQHADGEGPPLVIYAESGSGKSALVSYWSQQYRRRHPDVHLVEHYVGIGAGATDHLGIMRHVMAEIKERFARDEELPSSLEEIEREFANWLGFTSVAPSHHSPGERGTRTPMVLILDGLNQLQGNALNLAWLPQHIPSNIRLVVTSTIEQTLVALRQRGWQEMGVQPLTIAECEAAIVRYLAEYHKSLDGNQVRRIAEDRKSGSPLFLRTLLEELRLYGHHEHLERRIDYLLKTTGTEDLFQRVLERLEEDHGTRVVRVVMRLLWGASSGLSELELAELTDVSRMRLSSLVLALDYHLVRRDGLLSFFHDYLRRAVEKRYLSDDAKRRDVHLDLAAYFDRQAASQRTSRELSWQLHAAGENERLAVALSTISHFMVLNEGETEYEMLAYWKQLSDAGHDADEYFRRGLAERRQQGSEEWAAELFAVAELLQEMTHWRLAEALYGELLNYAEEHGERRSQMNAHKGIGEVQRMKGELAGAMDHFQRSLAVGEELGDRRGIAAAINSIGNVHSERGLYAEALECNARQLAISEELGDRETMAAAINNMGIVHVLQGHYVEGLECFNRSLAIGEGLGNRKLMASAIGNIGGIHFEFGRYTEALECYGRYLAINEELGDRRRVANGIVGIGRIHSIQGHYVEALEYFERSLAIGEELGDHMRISLAIGNIGVVHQRQGRFAEALDCFGRWLTISEEAGNRSEVYRAIGSIGFIHLEQREYAEALRCFREALDGHRSIGVAGDIIFYWLEGIATALVELAEQDGKRGEDSNEMPEYLPKYLPGITERTWRALSLRKAREYAEECLALTENVPNPELIFRAMLLLARVDAAEGRTDDAVQRMSRMVIEATDDGQRAESHFWLWKFGSPDDRADHRTEALRLFQQLVETTATYYNRKRIDELTASAGGRDV